jgi:hypothetical protein
MLNQPTQLTYREGFSQPVVGQGGPKEILNFFQYSKKMPYT